MFNDRLNVSVLVNVINIFREIEKNVKKLDSKERLINSHGIYLLAHLLFLNISKSKIYNPQFDSIGYINNEFSEDFNRYTKRLVNAYDEISPNNKFPYLFSKTLNTVDK
ncbi:hypothetical protein BC962_3225 [Gillisia mitskevichiae]|uniref:Uncharacterized protein n=1 Tax=Gillisia mitskevichiae TaxID=270921 RepID=A0A495NZG8_9FLAO|nr:hypothetical protein BC962_3225 [Gillisia mitskevichiae]